MVSRAFEVKAKRQLFVVRGGLRPRVAKLIVAIVLAACCACRANSETSPLSQARSAFKTHISFSGQEPGAPTLLTAETRNPFRAVFAFGPVGDVSVYGRSPLPIDFSQGDQRERTLRSPGYWLPSASGQVFVIEGPVQLVSISVPLFRLSYR